MKSPETICCSVVAPKIQRMTGNLCRLGVRNVHRNPFRLVYVFSLIIGQNKKKLDNGISWLVFKMNLKFISRIRDRVFVLICRHPCAPAPQHFSVFGFDQKKAMTNRPRLGFEMFTRFGPNFRTIPWRIRSDEK